MPRINETLNNLAETVELLRQDLRRMHSTSEEFVRRFTESFNRHINNTNAEEARSRINRNNAQTEKNLAQAAVSIGQLSINQKFANLVSNKNNVEMAQGIAKLQETILKNEALRNSLEYTRQQYTNSNFFSNLFNSNNNINSNEIDFDDRINSILNKRNNNSRYERKSQKILDKLNENLVEQVRGLTKDQQEIRATQANIQKVQSQTALNQINLQIRTEHQEFLAKKNTLDLAELEAKAERNRLKDQAWKEDRAYELDKREKELKEEYRESYKENLFYRSGSTIANAHTGFGTSIMMSALTGGVINPAVIQALKLDKLLTAPLAAFGKSLLRSNKAGKTTSATKNSKFSPILSKLDVIINKFNKKKKSQLEKEKKESNFFEKLGNIFGNLGMITGFLGISGIALLIKHLFPKTMKAIGNKFSKFLERKTGFSEETSNNITSLIGDMLPGAIAGYNINGFKGMLIGAGLSLTYTYIQDKIENWKKDSNNSKTPSMIGPIKANTFRNLLNGALIGSTFGITGALIGAGIGGTVSLLEDFTTTWKAIKEEGFTYKNKMALLEELGTTAAAIAGAIYGYKLGGPKGMLIGAGLAFAGKLAFDFVMDAIKDNDHTKTAKMKEENRKLTSLEYDLQYKLGVERGLGNTKNAEELEKLLKEFEETRNRARLNYNFLMELKNQNDRDGKAIKEWENTTGLKFKDELKKTENLKNYLINQSRNKIDGPLFIPSKEYIIIKGNFINEESSEKIREQTGTNTKKSFDTFMSGEVGIPDTEGNGYGSYNPSLLNYSGNAYKQKLVSNANRLGINPILLEDMGLKGSINNPWSSGGNSIPAINEKNKDNLAELDNKLNEWGYDVVYTSAMGGHILNSGHGRGNKVDLQLKKNGQPTHLTNSELYALRDAGYWGTGTGALGWEPVLGQVGGGHYDLFVGGQNSNINTPIKSLESNNLDEGINLVNGYSGSSRNNVLDLFTGVYKGISSLQNNNFSLDTDNIPSSEMANTNALTQLNNAIGGTTNDLNNNSLSNLIADVASNTARNNQVSNQPIVYNNISNNSSNDDGVYPVGDLAKTLLYA